MLSKLQSVVKSLSEDAVAFTGPKTVPSPDAPDAQVGSPTHMGVLTEDIAGDPEKAKVGESGLTYDQVQVGDVLTLHDDAMELKAGATFEVVDGDGWSWEARFSGNGESYRFGNNGLRFMTRTRG